VPNIQFSPRELEALLLAPQTQTIHLKTEALSSAAFKLKALAESERTFGRLTDSLCEMALACAAPARETKRLHVWR